MGSFFFEIYIRFLKLFHGLLNLFHFLTSFRLLAYNLFHHQFFLPLISLILLNNFHSIILQILKHSALDRMLNYFSKHFIILNHQITDFGVKGVLSIRIGYNVDQTTYYAG